MYVYVVPKWFPFAANEAGPPYGTGYCDAQCPHDIKWINGEANSEVCKLNGSGVANKCV